MDFLNLLARLADLDTTALPAAAPRRAALGRLGQAGTALLPALLFAGALPQPAAAAPQDTRTRLDVLLLARQISVFENEFYSQALGLVAGVAAVPLSATEKTAVQTLQQQEALRVALFSKLITDGGATLPTAPRYDFTGSKNGTKAALYPDLQTSPDTFLRVAQLLEDAGGRALLGQAEYVRNDGYLFEAVVRAQSVEARHASHIRTMRRQRGATVKSWVSPADAAITTAGTVAAKVYEGESNTVQVYTTTATATVAAATVSVPFSSTLPINVGTPPLTPAGILEKVAEAFDEPFDAIVYTNLADLFTY
ncbi:hypothetical protein CDA63_12840 [Hymenobacter amundsenii]|uniref:Ferritin-like domain-containing protein n=1 Tax=Hymenobacter amundsenii TaxID=2006685 RepID=A0A246FJA7_9BACT|nr:ferritin-like domain-containing protein [Hymenobacter amundsenii]OWP62654.1 hypothetical protein CDA63_12840 [Hymenobacter amundsenii]